MPFGARSKTFPGDGAARRGVRPPPRSEVVYNNQKARFAPELRRTRLSLSATSDYWVNAMAGDPVFVVTAPANAGLVKMLPGVLAQIRSLVGQRRLTGVFDRCGFSPKLFQQSLAAGFDLLTYRKGRHPKIPQKRFGKYRTSLGGRISTYTLADQEVRLLKGTLRLRQVTRRMDNGPQTPILTARRDLAAAQVAYRMFDRWRQENFFKYLREEYALDALVEYATTPDDATREVPNPAWAAADTKVRQADAQWERLQAEYGAGGVEPPGAAAPNHARIQNGARKTGPENLGGLGPGPATGEADQGLDRHQRTQVAGHVRLCPASDDGRSRGNSRREQSYRLHGESVYRRFRSCAVDPEAFAPRSKCLLWP